MTPGRTDATAGGILVEDAAVVSLQTFAADQFVLRLRSPGVAAAAQPGCFVHLRCAGDLPMRRPLSVMRADPGAGWIDLLFKVVGRGTRALAQAVPGDSLSLLGPIGNGFSEPDTETRPLLIGGGVGIPPMVFFAERLRRRPTPVKPVVLLGSQVPFPFQVRPSLHLLEGMPAQAIGTMPLLDDWGVPCRLASENDLAGCYSGYVTDLARAWLQQLDAAARQVTRLYACGPGPMLAAVAALAGDFGLDADLCLEEYMACGVGGCAGCVVKVTTAGGTAMRRVCVDGPVFPARAVYPDRFRRAATG